MQSGAPDGPDDGDISICADTCPVSEAVMRTTAITTTLDIVLCVGLREEKNCEYKSCERKQSYIKGFRYLPLMRVNNFHLPLLFYFFPVF